jgi:hypothetical protein
MIKHDVIMRDNTLETVTLCQGLTKLAAIETAKIERSRYPHAQVYIKWYRKSDGQRAYLNTTGYEIIGRPW